MHEFFRGWRRKVGCATLVMACVFAGLWIRTYAFADQVWCVIRGRIIMVGSVRGGAYFASAMEGGMPPLGWQVFSERELFTDHGNATITAIIDESFAGVPHGCMMYWHLTAPLILLSAYLLLWKPRPKPEPKPDA